MITKINKYISLFILLISLISFVGFGYYDLIADHFLRITDNSKQFILFYWFNSFVSSLVYYVGPWLIVPSVFLSLNCFFGKVRNNLVVNVFYQPISLLFSFIFCGYFFPSFLSKTLLGFFNYLENFYISFIFLILFFLLVWFFDINDYVFKFFSKKGSDFYSYCVSYLKQYWNSKFGSFVPLSNSSNSASKQVLVTTVTSVDDKSVELAPLISQDSIVKDNSKRFDLLKRENSPVVYEGIKSKLNDIVSKRTNLTKNQVNHSFTNYFETVNLKPGKRNSIISSSPDNNYFQKIIDRIEEKLLEFKIDGKIINILKGPVVDTFELELGSGVKVSKVTSSAEDLSLALYGAPIRIVYPMKGRTTVGIEVPRNPREVIYLDELLNSKEFKNTIDRLPLAMGKDAFGLPFIVDLVGMPHMLVAGATGAGKSVFINTILVSLLVKKTPEEMKLILIDPKQLELALYATLPHLIMPVVTDAKRASLSLLWAVDEMERRYTILKEVGVRNIDGFNDKIGNEPQSIAKIQHLFKDDEVTFKLPYIVIIVDEFADLILTKAGKEIENNICRLAAKARAAGIHLIIATQRPSVDVITGLIKSNFPTRVSFRVTTSIDSRTILNSVGAERLLGKGDMLYKHGVDTIRVHSSFVDEVEIEKLTYSLAQFETGFDDSVIEYLENGGEKEKDPYSFGSHLPSLKEEIGDELFDQAVEIVSECRSASASMLQRRLKVGYNRAANLVELMEEKGIVGPAQGSKPRKVLIASK